MTTMSYVAALNQAWAKQFTQSAAADSALIFEYDDMGTPVEGIEVTEIVLPEIPPEVWNERPIDAERAMAAVRAMCG
jgi:hypothetical protein